MSKLNRTFADNVTFKNHIFANVVMHAGILHGIKMAVIGDVSY